MVFLPKAAGAESLSALVCPNPRSELLCGRGLMRLSSADDMLVGGTR